MEKKVAIIGSGFGALSLAIRLQVRGFKVTIYEKNKEVGGHASQIKKLGYTFDMGPSIITAPFLIEKIFKLAKKSLNDYVDMIKLDTYYRVYFYDKTFIDYSADKQKMKAQMAKFNLHDSKNYDKFMRYTQKLYKAVIIDELGAKPFSDLKSFISFIPSIIILKAFLPVYTVVKMYFKDFRHRFIFSFHPLFIGGNPFRAPSLYLMIPYLEVHDGVFFTKGGMYSLVKAFENLFLDLGGVIQTKSEVTKITIDDNNQASGVVVNNELKKYDIVVSNAHFAHTYKDLIDTKFRKKWTNDKIKKLDYSMSCFIIFIGVRKKYPKLLHHTLILSKRYKGLIKDIFDNKILANDFSMYLHVPSKTDPSMAPEGCESMYVLIPVANLAAKINWDKESDIYRDKILKFLEEDFGLEDLRKNIEVLETYSPKDFKNDRNNYLGSAWGVEPKLFQTANFRPHNKSEDIKGLYLVGASTHPGGGVPGVLLTAETTEKVILKDN